MRPDRPKMRRRLSRRRVFGARSEFPTRRPSSCTRAPSRRTKASICCSTRWRSFEARETTRASCSPAAFAAGMVAGVADPSRADAIGARARELAETKYSYEAYLEKTRQACAALEDPTLPGAIVKDVA